MKKKNLFAVGIITALLLTGCSNNTETENLKKQIATLEQQIADMEQASPATEEKAAESTDHSATSTMDELTALVDDFVTRAEAAAPGSDDTANMETFFALKKEGNQIENDLDRYEDELEKLYRDGSLTHDDFRSAERETERLEDKLDDAEDRLEYTFGIDD